ncbi:alkaline phosphatase D family protein [Membranicola marinus]|uniref:Alkaline phosphatase D family protein n=1 Tax=Membranihabitans marinus TaxID=1227546 RepID=A0A953HV84_9BACT|nr:alkaline phosphatase D family protein [Membranihabitans marinus]MBY5958473.1 alkaline phosphatase D family protein [Membranihabitans marinus]
MAAPTPPSQLASSVHELQTQRRAEREPETSNPFYLSSWHEWPDMVWTGPEFWANRMQDWEIHNKVLRCNLCGPNRNIQLLTHQLSDEGNFMQTSIALRWNEEALQYKGTAGFRWGIQGRFDDYRSACVTGQGISSGIDQDGHLILGSHRSGKPVEKEFLLEGVDLKLFLNADGKKVTADLSAWYEGRPVVTLQGIEFEKEAMAGNIGLFADFEKPIQETWSVQFDAWELRGDLLDVNEEQVFGPVYFAQYTINNNVLKMTAQLAPLDQENLQAELWFREKKQDWQKVDSSAIDGWSRTAHFRVEDHDASKEYDYKVTTALTLGEGAEKKYEYKGRIAAEPHHKDTIKAVAFSCNWDLGFPDNELVRNAGKHDADLALFLGDQFYEPNGGFGIQMEPPEKAALDYLRKWVQFGWAHRDLFRHIPSICLPDDHDVFHGNVWGEEGKATIKKGGAAARQDSGGYKMPGPWVNIVQRTQTSHMPDPFDPTPVKQDITVFYTSWKYGGIDFGIIEDRKFKSAPKNILPANAEVFNGYAENPDFDFSSFKDYDTAQLIGDRQKIFLEEWVEDWSDRTQIKALLSATSFMTLQTLPEGTKNDQITPKLEIPEPGQYVSGDYYTRDMDSNGWPQIRRDEIVRILRKAYATHIVGDQHLASVAQYGVDEFQDSSFVFTVPAITSIWPRRWWPPVTDDHRGIMGREKYTGNFHDGFGNKMTVFSVANPVKTGLEPALLYDRSTGYGVVHFDKSSRRIRFECWPRFSDPAKGNQGQYDDWPFEINQLDNFGFSSRISLPPVEVTGLDNPVVMVYDKAGEELVSAIRVPESRLPYQASVLAAGEYVVKVGEPDRDLWKEQKVSTNGTGTRRFEF